MRDLVSDHHADATEVEGLWLMLTEERWLKDARGKYWTERTNKTEWGFNHEPPMRNNIKGGDERHRSV